MKEEQNCIDKRKKRKGFTLVELMVVMAILGILVLIAVARFQYNRNLVRSRVLQANTRILASAVITYRATEDVASNPTKIGEVRTYLPEETFNVTSDSQTVSGDNSDPEGARYEIRGNNVVGYFVSEIPPHPDDSTKRCDTTTPFEIAIN